MKLFFSKSDLQTYVGFNDRWAMLIGVLPIAELSNILFIGAHPGMRLMEHFTCFGISLAFTICFWVISRIVVINVRMVYPKRDQTVWRITVALAILALTTFFICAISMPLTDKPDGILERSLTYKFVMSFTLVLMVIAIYEGVFFFVKYKESLLEQERLAKENMQAQLSVLKQQMNPHFLFNSLNTLVNIIPENTEQATLFTQRLAAVYRRILEYRHKELIPLTEELRALQDYVYLMKTRFEDKLIVEWCTPEEGARPQVQYQNDMTSLNIPPYLRHHRIVPLAIQLLVENAIKHNVISSAHPLLIRITFMDEAIIVSNQLRLRERKLSSTGWGHENLRERYRAITDNEIVIETTPTTYSVSLPILSPREVHRVATA